MLLTLGLFVFGVQSAPFDTISRSNGWRWPSNDRTGADQVYQYTGRDEETISLAGTLMPEFSGGPSNIEQLRTMADAGEPYLMMSGSGQIYGYYIITDLSENGSYLLADGTAQKIEFSMTLKRYASNVASSTRSPLIPLSNRWF